MLLSKVQTNDSVICARVKDVDGAHERCACICVSRHTPRLVHVFHACVVRFTRDMARLAFGVVDFIIELSDYHPFLAVRWFPLAPMSRPLAEDVVSGVRSQQVRPPRARRGPNMWISIEDVYRGRCLYSSELGVCLMRGHMLV